MSLNERGLEPLRALCSSLAFFWPFLVLATKIKAGALELGSFSWLLDTIQHHGFDKADGVDPEVVPLASSEATRVGRLNRSLDFIVTDSPGAAQFGLQECA